MNAFIISQALREFTGDQGYIFDPEGFVTDEHGGNRESIRRMLKPGAVDRAKSCENHFYDCGHKQERRDWSSGSKLTFRKMLHEIYHAPTPGAFEANRRKLIDWTDKKNRKTKAILNPGSTNFGSKDECMYSAPLRVQTRLIPIWQRQATRVMPQEVPKISRWPQ